MGAIQNSVNNALASTAIGAGLVNKGMEKFASETNNIGKSNEASASKEIRKISREAENSQEMLKGKEKELKASIGNYVNIKDNYHEADRRKVLYGANKQTKAFTKEYHDMEIMDKAINSVYRQSQAILSQSDKVSRDIAILNNRGIIGKLMARNEADKFTKDIQEVSDAHKAIYNKETK